MQHKKTTHTHNKRQASQNAEQKVAKTTTHKQNTDKLVAGQAPMLLVTTKAQSTAKPGKNCKETGEKGQKHKQNKK